MPYLGAFAGVLLMLAVLGVNYTDNIALVVTCMTVTFFGNGLASIGWVFVSSMAPTRILASSAARLIFVNVFRGDYASAHRLAGARWRLPASVGLYRGDVGDWLFSYLFLVGKDERIE